MSCLSQLLLLSPLYQAVPLGLLLSPLQLAVPDCPTRAPAVPASPDHPTGAPDVPAAVDCPTKYLLPSQRLNTETLLRSFCWQNKPPETE